MELSHFRAQTIRDPDKIRTLNRFLISKSSLVVQGQCFEKMELRLEVDMNSIRRIYVNCPAPMSSMGRNKYNGSSKIADLFRLAALLTDTPGISAYFSQNCGMINYLLRSYENERNGAQKMTAKTIDPEINVGSTEKVDSLVYSTVTCPPKVPSKVLRDGRKIWCPEEQSAKKEHDS